MQPIQKIGLIAGQGEIPPLLTSRWQQQGLTPVVVGLRGITPEQTLTGHISAVFSIGQAGHILDFFKSHGVTKLVMVGGLQRPNFWTLRTDATGFSIVLKLLFRKIGDDTLLRIIRSAIEKYGIAVAGVHEFLPELLCPQGVLGHIQPTASDRQVIKEGLNAAKHHGAADKGQSVIINDHGVIGFEDVAGTNALIASCAGRDNAILVKVSKPQQDMALDMPTIGVSTVENAHRAGLKGIAVEAGKTIIMNRDAVIESCNRYGLFLIGASHDI